MTGGGFFIEAAVFLSAAVVTVPIAKRLGLGSVLGYLIAGIAVGPFGIGFVAEQGEEVLHFAEFGVVLMLFLVGLELKPSLLWRLRAPILGLGGLQVLVTTAAIFGIAIAFGLSPQEALAVGLTLALSSTAIALQTLDEKGLLPQRGGQSAFSVLLFQDIAVIPILAILPLLAVAAIDPKAAADVGHGSSSWIETLPAWGQALTVLGAVVGVICAGRFLVAPFLRVLARTRLPEMLTAAALLLVIGVALLMNSVGLSPALGTFLAGVVLANSPYRHQLETDIAPFKGLLLGLFFIAVGATIDFNLIGSDPVIILVLVLILIVAKLVILLVLGRVFGLSGDQNLIFGCSLAQGSEFAFVLLSFSEQNGVLGKEPVALLVAVVAVSMALAPVLMILNERLLLPRIGTKEVDRPDDDVHEHNPVIIAGFGHFGHVCGRLLIANGVGATVLDNDSDQVDFLRELGLEVYYGDASRLDLLRTAGAEQAKVIIVAVDEDKSLEVVRTVKEHFPHLQILARANGRPQAYELLQNGVEHVYRQTLDTSLRAGVDALCHLGFRRHQAVRAARRFRRRDEAAVRDLAPVWSQREIYITRARDWIRGIEQQIRRDVTRGREPGFDSAWDTETLREEYGLPENERPRNDTPNDEPA